MTKPEIIAEIGINHNGNMNLAKSLIQTAQSCGADVVKFQFYDPYEVLNKSDFLQTKDWEAIVNAASFTYGQVVGLYNYCEHWGIEFMASVFDLERLDWLIQLPVKRFKIASRSIYDKKLVQTIQAQRRPYFVSMGMIDKTKEEVYDTWKRLWMPPNATGNTTYMFCVSKYPTPLGECGLYKNMFENSYDSYAGYSDHTIGTTAAKMAIAYGARVVEKHLTVDKSMVGPDHKCSATSLELAEICKFRDEYWETRVGWKGVEGD